MSREKELEKTLTELIRQTEQALENGAVYSNEFKKNLRAAKEKLTRLSIMWLFNESSFSFFILL